MITKLNYTLDNHFSLANTMSDEMDASHAQRQCAKVFMRLKTLRRKRPSEYINLIAIDLAKSVFQVCLLN